MAKRWLAIGVFTAALIVGTGIAFAEDNPTVKWGYVSVWDTNNPTIKADQYVAEKVNKATNGKFSIKVYVAGAMVPAYEAFDAVSSGAFPAGSTSLGYQVGINSAFGLYCGMPLHTSQQDFLNWLYYADGLKLLNEILEKYNLVAFPSVIFDLESGFRSHKKATKLEDFKGMKMRIGTPECQAVMQRLGASVVSISGGVWSDALQRGIIDAFEYMMPAIDWQMGFQEIAEYWLAPAWFQPTTASYTLVNLDAWKALPENYRVIFEEAAKGSLVENMAFQNVESAVATKKFLDYGVKVAKAGEGDPAFWSKMEVIVKEVLEDFASKNPDYARVLKSQVDYLKTYMAWKEVTSPFHSGRIPESLENLPEVKDAWLKK